MDELTSRLRQVLELITLFIENNGYPLFTGRLPPRRKSTEPAVSWDIWKHWSGRGSYHFSRFLDRNLLFLKGDGVDQESNK